MKIRKDRLKKLAKHLERGRLAHALFNFAWINRLFDEQGNDVMVGYRCGSSGCALGECPAIFKNWKWFGDAVYYGRFKNDNAAEKFFGLSNNQAMYLFYPEIDGIDTLPKTATRFDVANRIREFIKNN